MLLSIRPLLALYPKRRIRGTVLTVVLLGLLAACGQPAPTQTPPPTLVASLTPSPDIQAAVGGTLTAMAPTLDAQQATVEFVPDIILTATPTEKVVELPAVTGEKNAPPLDITLPEGWQFAYDTQVLPDVDNTVRPLPFALYTGPITGGTGTIVLLWGFPNLVNPFPEGAAPIVNPVTGDVTGPVEVDLWADGLRLLRLSVMEPDCNLGTDVKRTYRIGTLTAVGTQFAAVDCPQFPDTRGWFAGLQESGVNFIFYVYTDPIAAMDTSRDELQAILDTVIFHVPQVTPEATAQP